MEHLENIIERVAMGIGFQVSALHKIAYMEPVKGAPPSNTPPPAWLSLLPNAQWDPRPREYASLSTAKIVGWREGIAAKYRHQLGETLLWDETSPFSLGEDAATNWDFVLHYVAAVIDLNGTAKAARLLKDQKKPKPSETDAIFEAVEKRGFTGKFPQLLLDARYWLPFRRNMIIEEPNWRGDIERYGSTARLVDEVVQIRRFIQTTDPKASASKDDDDESALAAAWKAADIIHRLGKVAVAKHLPFWTTG